jgi:hypothetical protein
MRFVVLCLLTVSSAAWPATGNADPIPLSTLNDRSTAIAIVIHIDDQGVLHRDDEQQFGGNASTAADLSFQGNSGRAVSALSSTVTEHRLSGVGDATATTTSTVANQGHAIATAAFALTFELTTPQLADFSVQFTGDTNDPHTDVTAGLNFASSTQRIVQRPDLSVPFALHRRDLLQPGLYFFDIRSDAVAFFGSLGVPTQETTRTAHSAFSFGLELHDSAPVPEPASLLLLATGASLVLRRTPPCRAALRQ